MIGLIVVLAVAAICIDIKLNISSKKIKLRKEFQERQQAEPVEWYKVQASIPDGLGATKKQTTG